MKRSNAALLFATACAVGGAAPAVAAKSKCNIVGTFTDTRGTTVTFPTNRKGTGSNASICPGTYVLKVTALTLTDFDFAAKSKNKSCPAVSAALTFQDGGCSVASGTVTVNSKGNFKDTFTKTDAPAGHRAVQDRFTALGSGLK